MNYYNDNDKFVCAWLRELIKAKLIPNGDVDERSIKDVDPVELAGYTQCHFFAGIGGWSYALKLAGWPEERKVWTGSCPCQPFSVAGKANGVGDERHLWPAFHRIIAKCNPPVVFGEQVAGKAGREWLSGIRVDMEALGYAVGAAGLCAPIVNSPHGRPRIYWLANSRHLSRETRTISNSPKFTRNNGVGGMEHSNKQGLEGSHDNTQSSEGIQLEHSKPVNGMVHSNGCGREETHGSEPSGKSCETGYWSDWTTIECGDGKTRRVAPGLTTLAHGIPARMVRLRGYGNAIVPQVAAEFIGAYMEIEV